MKSQILRFAVASGLALAAANAWSVAPTAGVYHFKSEQSCAYIYDVVEGEGTFLVDFANEQGGNLAQYGCTVTIRSDDEAQLKQFACFDRNATAFVQLIFGRFSSSGFKIQRESFLGVGTNVITSIDDGLDKPSRKWKADKDGVCPI